MAVGSGSSVLAVYSCKHSPGFAQFWPDTAGSNPDFYSPTLKVAGDINVGSGEEERAADWARVY